ncbi:hypothetical protein I7I53_00555 [Histoplasma capsulatum var. duboisii H88]|uniref:Uncharacterized protein n=1 Tax=Ajellomyces capsulatus (strain H88) TaxID=544711 RepID=A0A8A1LN58_AJEC8|nr:hypothetical protein I7I53_00555 [Histoplasma capsulatum var. duboisii H88]
MLRSFTERLMTPPTFRDSYWTQLSRRRIQHVFILTSPGMDILPLNYRRWANHFHPATLLGILLPCGCASITLTRLLTPPYLELLIARLVLY